MICIDVLLKIKSDVYPTSSWLHVPMHWYFKWILQKLDAYSERFTQYSLVGFMYVNLWSGLYIPVSDVSLLQTYNYTNLHLVIFDDMQTVKRPNVLCNLTFSK